MNFKSASVLSVSFVLLSACEDPMVVGRLDAPPTGPNFKPAAQSVALQHLNLTAVRTFSAGGDEIEGATCRLDTPYYDLTLTTPGVANLPSFGPQTPTIAVTCSSGGRTAQTTVSPFNQSTELRAAAAAGIMGAGGTAAIAAGTAGAEMARNEPGRSTDRYAYSTIRVEF